MTSSTYVTITVLYHLTPMSKSIRTASLQRASRGLCTGCYCLSTLWLWVFITGLLP